MQRRFVKRHVHFGERHGRAQRDEKRAKLSRLVGLPIQHELNQRAVGNQIAMQVIPLDVFKMLEAVTNGVRQRAVVIVICHQRNQSRRKDDASGAHFHRRPGLVALHFGQRLTAEFQNRVAAGARQAHADGGHVVERAA